MKILVLDRCEKDRSAIKAVLSCSDQQHSICEAVSADDALFRMSSCHFDVVLADHKFSDIDGMKLLRALKRAAIISKTAIVMTSSDVIKESDIDYIRAGAHDFLPKSDVTFSRIQRAHITAQYIFTLEQNLRDSDEKIKRLSYCDSVTGLANKTLLAERLHECIKNHTGSPLKIGLMYLRLDRLRYLDQNQGASVNELLLRKAVNRIKGCLQGRELFARIEGELLAIMCPAIQDFTEVGKIAQRIVRVMERPITIDSISYMNQASVGIALFPDNAIEMNELDKYAGMALEKARSNTVDRIAYYQSTMKDEYTRHFDIETGLREAISKNQFGLHFQPVFNPKTKSVIGFEALIRWHAPEKSYSPAEFIPVAEESSLIMEIGRWVIKEAIHQLSKWNTARQKPFTMSINLSPRQLADPRLVSFIEDTLNKENVDPKLIEFELTETALLENSIQNITTIGRITALGCSIALDDFGTGFSSFSHLKSFPISSVKIDRSLMPSSPDNEAENSLIRGLVSMISSLGLQIIGEGAETAEHARLCADLGMDAVQGYYFSAPMAREHIERRYMMMP